MLVDIAFNSTSEAFSSEIDDIVIKCRKSNVMPLMVGLDIESSCSAALLARKYNTFSYFGIHPLHSGNVFQYSSATTCLEPVTALHSTFKEKLGQYSDSIIAVGECGLDYFRSNDRERQIALFEMQLEIAREYSLPCFIHCRNAFEDVYSRVDGIAGVVHSFDGSAEQARSFIGKGLYIGINGCSMRSEESISVIKQIPVEKVLLETDSPYCMIRKSYAAAKYTTLIKSKENKPEYLWNILEAFARIKGMDQEEVSKQVLKNTTELFPKLHHNIKFWMDPSE